MCVRIYKYICDGTMWIFFWALYSAFNGVAEVGGDGGKRLRIYRILLVYCNYVLMPHLKILCANDAI